MDKNRSMSGKVRPVTMKGFSLLAGGSGYRVHVIFQGLAVGLTAGFASILYRILLGQAERFSFFALSGEEPIPIPLLVPLWCLAAWVIGRIMEWEPLARGSGIPQVEGELLGQISMNWWRVLTAKFLGGALSIALGLSLGREGPSIQIGSASGKGIARLGKKDTLEERLMISSGASAGLSAAFNAPLAGVVFALEEVHKSFSPLILLSAMTASLAADAVSKYVFGLGPIFSFGAPEPLIAFVQAIQAHSPVDSYASPEPWDMPGYQDQVIMAAGTFVPGASIELSCDAPIRPPFTAYLQGALTYAHGKLALESALQSMNLVS